VLEDGVIVGRIFKVPIAPEDRPWMWASGYNGHIRRAAHGYEPTREAAMAALLRAGAEGATAAASAATMMSLLILKTHPSLAHLANGVMTTTT
jgi:hypothetical protein